MKLYSYSTVFCFILALTACDRKSTNSADDKNHADAAISADDPEVCAVMAETMGLHGDLEGYTASAQSKFHVKIDWSTPLVSGELINKATVTFVDHHAEPLALKLSSFKLFMPAMGHGSGHTDKLVFTQDAANKNIWSVEQIYFSMGGAAGSWVVDIEGSACGVSDKARVEIPVEVQ